jgi:zinc transport system substrate-binding protein
MRIDWWRVAALIASVALGPSCSGDDQGGPGETNDEGAVTVVASFYPLAEIAEEVGGDPVEVTNLTPAGTEPHDLELTADEVDQLLDADLVVYLGGGFQPAVEAVVETRDGPTVDVLEGLSVEAGAAEALEAQEAADEDEGDEDGHDEGGALDPHVWLDPTLMADIVGSVTDALIDAAPDNTESFEANAADYKATLDELDAEFEESLASCERRQIVTSHAAFFYLARRYDLEQLPIADISPEVEPDPERLDDLAALIEAEGITTVFSESLVSPEVAETLARETGVVTAVLNPIEGLTADELDAGEDYSSVMRTNLASLQQALGCD